MSGTYWSHSFLTGVCSLHIIIGITMVFSFTYTFIVCTLRHSLSFLLSLLLVPFLPPDDLAFSYLSCVYNILGINRKLMIHKWVKKTRHTYPCLTYFYLRLILKRDVGKGYSLRVEEAIEEDFRTVGAPFQTPDWVQTSKRLFSQRNPLLNGEEKLKCLHGKGDGG